MYLFLAVLGLCCCLQTLSSCGEWWLLVAERRLQGERASEAVAHGLMLCSMWDLPGPGIEPVSLVLARGFFTTEPPG